MTTHQESVEELKMSTNNRTLCILTAGEGTRLLPLTEKLNKCLVPVNREAIISKILRQISPETKIVVALGHKGELVKEFLLNFHPQFQYEFVEVQNYNGVKSGPGVSLLACKNLLKMPFSFVACDTIWDRPLNELPTETNWVGVSASVPEAVRHMYCNLEINEQGEVTTFHNKVSPKDETQPFIGLGHIIDFEEFFKALEDSVENKRNYEIYPGLEALTKKSTLKSVQVEWTDLGNLDQIAKVSTEPFDFSKPDEFIWFESEKVIKFFKSKEILDKKYRRHQRIRKISVDGLGKSEHFIFYNKAPGQTLYNS